MERLPPPPPGTFESRLARLKDAHEQLLAERNSETGLSNGIFQRWANPVLTAAHVPLHWRYDFSPERNPWMMERLGMNAVFNAGAIHHKGQHVLAVRAEGADRKSFFALARSENGVDRFIFDAAPIALPQTDGPDTNVYDMRLTAHEDGCIYGLFCTERKDRSQMADTSAAVAQCGIVRTRDLIDWERLPDLKTGSGQQRNVVLHPEFIDGKYGLYTRPQDGFIAVGGGGGIGWGLCDDMAEANIREEMIVDPKIYHTIKELKNGQGPAPLKTPAGWLHLAHGVRNTAAGLRYVLYMFVTSLDEPWNVTHRPGGYLIAPEGVERTGDVSNVVFCNGWTVTPAGEVFIYYASSDTRLHVATTSLSQLIDYCLNTPEDPLTSRASVDQRIALIEANTPFLNREG
ncbi:MAG: glycosidase [Hyphomonas sp.]